MAWILGIAGSILLLIYGQDLIIPFVLALILWFIIKEIRELLQRSAWIKEKVPSMVLTFGSFILVCLVLGWASNLLAQNLLTLSKELAKHQGDLSRLETLLQDYIGADYQQQLKSYLGNLNFAAILEPIINTFFNMIGDAVMILLYLVFIILEEQIFRKKLHALYPDKEDYQRTREILAKIDRSLGKYIGLKSLISLITAVCSYIVLLMYNVEAPVFWAGLIFVLNFIPTIGSLIATLFPVLFALVQYGDVGLSLQLTLALGVIQVIMGNILEPKIMGDSLNISALVVILSLSIWGAIWGVTGMILSVPITVSMAIIFAAFPKTKKIAILLSENAEL